MFREEGGLRKGLWERVFRGGFMGGFGKVFWLLCVVLCCGVVVVLVLDPPVPLHVSLGCSSIKNWMKFSLFINKPLSSKPHLGTFSGPFC